MKVIWVMVASVDAKSTKGESPDIYSWTSKEDSEYFFNLIKENNLIVMGSGTYKEVKVKIKSAAGKLRIILTSRPSDFLSEAIVEQLEFSDEGPAHLVQRLDAAGYKTMLLVSGAAVGTSFLKEKLIDELYLSIEPRIFGIGRPLVLSEDLDVRMKLQDHQKLNDQGTILLKYKIIK